MLTIDHVIYGARDMDAVAARWWSEHGLASYEGGVHPQYGTGNRIVPLGDSYIEVMGIADDSAASANPLGQFVLEQIADGDRWITWCLRTDDIASVAERIGSAPINGERHTPSGDVVAWTLTGLEIALTRPPLPFFIAWAPEAAYPGATPLEHRIPAPRIDCVEIRGNAGAIREHLEGAELPIIVTEGSGAVAAVRLNCNGDSLDLQ